MTKVDDILFCLQYIVSLEEMLNQLENESMQPSKETFLQYAKQLEFLKGLIATSKLPSPMERVVAAQMLPMNVPNTSESYGSIITTQIHQKTTAKYNQEIRHELFATKSVSVEDGLRQRIQSSGAENEDFDALLKHNQNMQEKIAENMLLMTNTIKEQAMTANTIIRKDIGYLEKADKVIDNNEVKLKKEALKLGEHTKSTWRCWVWVMVAFVIAVFFNMVLFMKVSKKKVV